MREDSFIRGIKAHLDQSTNQLNQQVLGKLQKVRQRALDHQAQGHVNQFYLAVASFGEWVRGRASPGVSSTFSPVFSSMMSFVRPHARVFTVVLALSAGAAAVAFWNDFQQANTVAEYAEIDTAILADELPINAYLDKGFHKWLEQSLLQH